MKRSASHGKTVRVSDSVGGRRLSHAREALAAVMRGPWPDDAQVRAVAAKQARGPHQRSIVLTTLDRRADDAAEQARGTLARRWPDADTVVVDAAPVNGILAEAKKFHAEMIAVGWRGYGPVRRLLMGSVSRGVVRGAKSAVLVVGNEHVNSDISCSPLMVHPTPAAP